MEQISTIRAVIALWPNRQALVDDLNGFGFDPAVTIHQVHKWPQAGAIPARYHQSIVLAAEKRGFALTAEVLVRLHDGRRAA